MALADIKTIVIVLLENRSFDHAAGYLSLPSANPPMPVEGLSDDPAWIARYANDDLDGTPRGVHLLKPDKQMFVDPPHESENIATQINTATHADAAPLMGGFVQSYKDAKPTPADRTPVMGYYDKGGVPVFDFFARNFAICDHWFSALPCGTQPNRLMAMSGASDIYDNVPSVLDFPNQPLAYDWMTEKVGANTWCEFQWSGFPFFFLMPNWRTKVAASLADPFNKGAFRRYNDLESGFVQQWANAAAIPDVVFIEPKYTDDPIPGPRNDDHPPTGILAGQKFLANIYNTIISNAALWKSTMMIVTYDEHGGFFDHAPPMAIPAVAGGKAFATTGPRVPAFVISPYVKPGSVFSGPLDHTSLLQLLADKHTPGQPYSAAVAARQGKLASLKTILDNPRREAPPPAIPGGIFDAVDATVMATAAPAKPATPIAEAFHDAVMRLADERPDLLKQPHLTHAAEYVAAARHAQF